MFFAGRVGGVFDLDGSSDDTEKTLIFGHVDRRQLHFDHTFLGASTVVYGSQNTVAGEDADADLRPDGDGEDIFLVDHLESMAVQQTTSGTIGETLTLDGQDETDTYMIKTWGSRDATPRSYIVNVLDTGAEDDGVDVLDV